MEKKNKSLVLFTCVVGLAIITVATVIKVYTNHINDLYKVVEKKITENACSCFLDEICTDGETTLGFLIQNGYLESQINPITKEFINEDLVITIKDGKCSTSIR